VSDGGSERRCDPSECAGEEFGSRMGSKLGGGAITGIPPRELEVGTFGYCGAPEASVLWALSSANSSGVACRTDVLDVPRPAECVMIEGTAVNSLFGPKVVGV
jgi:hypothetical protein